MSRFWNKQGIWLLPARTIGVYTHTVSAQMVRIHESFPHYVYIGAPATHANGSHARHTWRFLNDLKRAHSPNASRRWLFFVDFDLWLWFQAVSLSFYFDLWLRLWSVKFNLLTSICDLDLCGVDLSLWFVTWIWGSKPIFFDLDSQSTTAPPALIAPEILKPATEMSCQNMPAWFALRYHLR